MASSPLWVILWVLAAAITGAVMFGAWTGPHRAVSNLSRWAVRLRSPWIPAWLIPRAADRWAFRGGLVALVLLLAVAWLTPSQGPSSKAPSAPDLENPPAAPNLNPPAIPQRPARHVDAELKNAILTHVPKAKQVRIVVLRDDAEADQFAWEIDAFLRAEGYKLAPRMFFAMVAGGSTPNGTSMYPDEKDANTIVIRIGLNDRS
jgi:hypothetical protein